MAQPQLLLPPAHFCKLHLSNSRALLCLLNIQMAFKTTPLLLLALLV